MQAHLVEITMFLTQKWEKKYLSKFFFYKQNVTNYIPCSGLSLVTHADLLQKSASLRTQK